MVNDRAILTDEVQRGKKTSSQLIDTSYFQVSIRANIIVMELVKDFLTSMHARIPKIQEGPIIIKLSHPYKGCEV